MIAAGVAFPEAALRSQAGFRALMRAMSQPGRIELMPEGVEPPAPLMGSAASALTTLADFETKLWLAPEFAGVAEWLRFETGASLATRPEDAAFALVAAAGLDIARFSPGDPAYPDRGATIIVQCPSLSGGRSLMLAGPGIASTQAFAVSGLPEGFEAQMRANTSRFPLGVDLIFASGASIVALPRSTRILETP
jgi:alpha-D-ribose 1-methylphosphonate 5-triphosphate synthase subunit PhnH